MTATLIYCYDPMCSWCWGFRPIWTQLKKALAKYVDHGDLTIEPMLGGLAPDSEVPMPEEMRHRLEATWQRIHQELGTEFNFSFWLNNTPRRSTYPANRACLAARDQGLEMEMYAAIQQAYYLEARNPSDLDTLVECAEHIGLNHEGFLRTMHYIQHEGLLEKEIESARHIGLNSFPSLALIIGEELIHIPINYREYKPMLALIEQRLFEAL